MIELFDCNLRLGMRHQHVPGEPTTVTGLLTELDRLSVAGALVRHQLTVETDVVTGNRLILRELEPVENLLPTWSLLPETTRETGPDIEQTVDEMIRLGVRAVWLHPQSHGYTLREWCAGGLLSALEGRRVPVFMLWNEVTADELAQVLVNHPGLDVILCNVSYRTNRLLYPLFKEHPRLHMDLGAPHAQCGFIEEVVSRFGAERLLFGSGFPDHEIAPVVSYLLYADIAEADKRRIGADNLHTLLEGVT